MSNFLLLSSVLLCNEVQEGTDTVIMTKDWYWRAAEGVVARWMPLPLRLIVGKRIITDKLGSYAAARRMVMPNVEHRSHKGLNNRAENSHVPIRKRERVMQGFRSWSGLQRFVPIFSAVRNFFVPSRSHRSAFATRLHRLNAMAEWKSTASALA
jgi:hypothetical protein